MSRDQHALDARTDAYLRALAAAGIIPEWLRDETLRVRLTPRARVEVPGSAMFAKRKAVNAVRVQLSSQLGVVNLYDLDRLDLTVRTTLDGLVNDAVTRGLKRVGDCGEAAQAGLVASRLLNGSACGQVVYSFTPSYATSIGSSGDNPEALAELMGIIVNDCIRYPSCRTDQVHFAAGTPYDTRLTRKPMAEERVLSPAVALLVRRELVEVVKRGTGRRLASGVTLGHGQTLDIGGKTGTGDNRFVTGSSSRVVNRTAAFAFIVGDRFFGSMVAYVPGQTAAGYEFKSALPVQVVKHLLPALEPLLRFAGSPS